MANGIRSLELIDRSPGPASAEVWVRVEPEQAADGLELRGRLMGPRCEYSTTVELAYPLRPLQRPPEGEPGLLARVIIPEANLWDPVSPFYYEGPVELWQDGRRCDQRVVRHGLRQVSLGPRGLRWNGQPLTLRGRTVLDPDEETPRDWRSDGVNLLLAFGVDGPMQFAHLGDRFGFLILGRVESLDERSWRRALEPELHPGFLGWVIEPPALRLPAVERLLARGGPALLGVRLRGRPTEPLPPGLRFALTEAENAGELAGLGLPLLLLGRHDVEASAGDPVILGGAV
jgi:hypothetical protein